MLLRSIALAFAVALCVLFFTAEWATVRLPIEGARTVTAWDFFLIGIERTDASYNINGGTAFVWIILPLAATGVAILTILSGLTSRLFVLLASLGNGAALAYVVLLALATKGEVGDGAMMTAGACLGLLVTGLASRAVPSRRVVKGTPTRPTERKVNPSVP